MRRRRRRQRPACRPAPEPIDDLQTHPAATVTAAQLAPWWGVSVDTVWRWIRRGHPRYGILHGRHAGTREWVVPVQEARRFEAALFEVPPPVTRRPHYCARCGQPVPASTPAIRS